MAFDPEEVIKDLPLEKVSAAADLGCGAGGWTIPLAERLDKGVVFAIDILESPLSALQGKLNSRSIPNVKVLEEDIETGVSLKDNRVDLVLMTNFLFQVNDREKVFKEAKRILAKEGQLIVTEWKPDSPIAKGVKKVSPNEVKSLAKKFGFELKEEFQAGIYQFGFIYKK